MLLVVVEVGVFFPIVQHSRYFTLIVSLADFFPKLVYFFI